MYVRLSCVCKCFSKVELKAIQKKISEARQLAAHMRKIKIAADAAVNGNNESATVEEIKALMAKQKALESKDNVGYSVTHTHASDASLPQYSCSILHWPTGECQQPVIDTN